jgi:hypothetical protein
MVLRIDAPPLPVWCVCYQCSGGVRVLGVERGVVRLRAWLQGEQAARQLVSVNHMPPWRGGMMWSRSVAQPGQVGWWVHTSGSCMRQWPPSRSKMRALKPGG